MVNFYMMSKTDSSIYILYFFFESKNYRFCSLQMPYLGSDLISRPFFFRDVLPGKQCRNLHADVLRACWEFPIPFRSHFVWLRVSVKR